MRALPRGWGGPARSAAEWRDRATVLREEAADMKLRGDLRSAAALDLAATVCEDLAARPFTSRSGA